MALLSVKPGQTMSLPNGKVFLAGLGWDSPPGEKIDLDLWILRHWNTGLVEVISWANKDWHRPDLGRNEQGNPYIATPQLDVIHQGDDRTGAESAQGYDELARFDLVKTPTGVVKFSIYSTIYDEDNAGLTIGMASNVIFGVKDEVTGNELQTKPANEHSFDTSVHLADLLPNPAGGWSLKAIETAERGKQETMFAICTKLGVK